MNKELAKKYPVLEITLEELKKHYDKYVKLAEQEHINVTKNGKLCFSFLPSKEAKVGAMESLFGILPADAYFDKRTED